MVNAVLSELGFILMYGCDAGYPEEFVVFFLSLTCNAAPAN